VWAKPQAQAGIGRPYFFAQASKGGTLVETPVAPASVAPAIEQPIVQVAPVVPAAPAVPVAAAVPDGLSRQWLEFLSQLGATK
jgi:hypothetical protein